MRLKHGKICQTIGRCRRGFTLVEILIVVVILGILAAIVLPQFSNASQMARTNTLKDDLRYLRTQIGVYRAQHEDTAPGYPGGNSAAVPTNEVFDDQMTRYTNVRGDSSATTDEEYAFGPYLTVMPPNPITGKSGVHIYYADRQMPPPSQSAYPEAGWIYNPRTIQITANVDGVDLNGVSYADY